MAKPSSSKTVSFATHDYSQANAGKSSSRDKTGPRSSGTQSIKGYVYIDHPLVLPNEIFGDPTNLQNIIDGPSGIAAELVGSFLVNARQEDDRHMA